MSRPWRHRSVIACGGSSTPILVILAVIVFTVSVPAAWGARTVLNTDRYVATVAPLADDPAVQQAIATRLTDEVFAALNVQEVIRTRSRRSASGRPCSRDR